MIVIIPSNDERVVNPYLVAFEELKLQFAKLKDTDAVTKAQELALELFPHLLEKINPTDIQGAARLLAECNAILDRLVQIKGVIPDVNLAYRSSKSCYSLIQGYDDFLQYAGRCSLEHS